MQRVGRRYCDSCIQERLGLKWRQQVQLVTATLAVTHLFTRERSECSTCHEMKQVTAGVIPSDKKSSMEASGPGQTLDGGASYRAVLVRLPQSGA